MTAIPFFVDSQRYSWSSSLPLTSTPPTCKTYLAPLELFVSPCNSTVSTHASNCVSSCCLPHVVEMILLFNISLGTLWFFFLNFLTLETKILVPNVLKRQGWSFEVCWLLEGDRVWLPKPMTTHTWEHTRNRFLREQLLVRIPEDDVVVFPKGLSLGSGAYLKFKKMAPTFIHLSELNWIGSGWMHLF